MKKWGELATRKGMGTASTQWPLQIAQKRKPGAIFGQVFQIQCAACDALARAGVGDDFTERIDNQRMTAVTVKRVIANSIHANYVSLILDGARP